MYSSEKQFYSAISVAGIILGVIIIVFVVTMIRHQRRYFHFHKIKIKAEIAALEKERRRIANDLHDELGPILSAVRIQINQLGQSAESDMKIVRFANKYIDEILKKSRAISYNLLPNTLVRKGLIEAVREYINRLRETHPLQISLHGDHNVNLHKDAGVNIYRILQEIIHNTIKHANARHLIINFKRKDNMLLLITADDGKGFDFEQQKNRQQGLGLWGIQSRAEILNAKFNYKSEPGQGTQYIFEIPFNQNQSNVER